MSKSENSEAPLANLPIPSSWQALVLKLRRLSAALDEIEASEPVESWQVDGMHVWPILRRMAGSTTQWALLGDWDLLKPVLASLRAGVKQADSSEDQPSSRDLGPFDNQASGATWFFGNTANYAELGGVQVHTHFDALRAELEGSGQQTHAFLMHDLGGQSEQSARRWFRDCTPVADFTQTVSRNIKKHWRHTGDKLAPFLARMRSHPQLAEFPSQALSLHPEAVRLFVVRSLTMRDRFLEIFEARRPRAVVFYPGLTPLSYGISAAARVSSIASIELQHGINGSMHQGYSWSRTPKGGWNGTPERMLTWTASDSEQFKATGDRVPILNGPGSMRLARFLLLEKPSRAEFAERHEQLRRAFVDQIQSIHAIASARRRKPVLFAPQYQLNKNPLVDVVEERAGSAGIELLRREHPVVELRRTKQGADSVADSTTQVVTTSLLPAVLANSVGIVTGFSSMFLESALLGRPTISILAGGPYYYDSYLKEFGGGMVSLAADARSLDASLEQLASPSDDPLGYLQQRLSTLPTTPLVASEILS